MDPNRDMLNDIYRMTKENNQMLHAMRRQAFIGSIFKYTIWILLFVVAPLWIYSTYLAPTVEQMRRAIDQLQGVNTTAQVQMGRLDSMWESVKGLLPGGGTEAPTTN